MIRNVTNKKMVKEPNISDPILQKWKNSKHKLDLFVSKTLQKVIFIGISAFVELCQLHSIAK